MPVIIQPLLLHSALSTYSLSIDFHQRRHHRTSTINHTQTLQTLLSTRTTAYLHERSLKLENQTCSAELFCRLPAQPAGLYRPQLGLASDLHHLISHQLLQLQVDVNTMRRFSITTRVHEMLEACPRLTPMSEPDWLVLQHAAM